MSHLDAKASSVERAAPAPSSSSTYELLEHDRHPSKSFNPLNGVFEEKESLWSRIAPAVIIVLLFAVIAFEIVIIAIPIWLTGRNKDLPTADRTVYSTGVTVLASIITVLALGQIRNMWVAQLAAKQSLDSEGVRTAQVLLQIGGFRNQIRRWWLSAALIVFGLITTSIVGPTTITVKQRPYTTYNTHFQGAASPELYEFPPNTPWGNDCWYSTETAPAGNSTLAWFNSTTKSYLVYNDTAYVSTCPNSLFPTINTTQTLFAQYGFGYLPGLYKLCQLTVGGAVYCSALGAPISTATTCGILETFGCEQYTANRACVPTFTTNPLKCYRTPKPPITANSSTVTAVVGETCTVNASSHNARWQSNGSALIGFCPTADAYGDMTFVVGTNEPRAANLLTVLLGNTNSTDTSPIAVECSLSLNSTLDFTVVTNATANLDNGYGPDLPALNSTRERCDPDPGYNELGDGTRMQSIDQILNLNARMTAATLMYLTLNVPSLDDLLQPGTVLWGGNESTQQASPLAFNNSQNGIEDYLGVLLASAMSYYWGQDFGTSGDNNANLIYKLEYAVLAERIGSGTWVALMYLIPLLSAIGAILWLWRSSSRSATRGVHGHWEQQPIWKPI